MPRTSTSRRPSTALKREKLVRGATRAFLRDGYEATTMQKVADACRVGKGTLYEYFPSKEDLFIEVCISGFDTDREAIEAAFLKSRSPLKTIERVLEALLAETPHHLERMPLYFTLWARLSFDDRHRTKCHRAFRELYRDFREALARGIERAQERGSVRRDLEPSDLATIIMCAIDGYTYLRVFAARDVEVPRLEKTLAKVLLGGMTNRRGRQR